MRAKSKRDLKTIFGKRIIFVLAGLTVFSILGLSTVYVKLARAQFGYQPTIGSSQSDLRGVSARNTSDGLPSRPSEPEFISNELLVKVSKNAKGKLRGDVADTGISSLTQILKDHRVSKFEQVNKEVSDSLRGHEVFQWYLLTLDTPREKVMGKLDMVSKKLQLPTPNGKTQRSASTERAVQVLQAVIDRISADPNIEYVELNNVITPLAIPNDTYYSNLWGLEKIHAPEAWDISTGSPSVVVAVIDTGVNYNHPDLAQNIWVNAGEIPANGIDDDHNGYIDDYHGVDTINYDSDPMDESCHGTHVAGTIGAVGNNSLGVTGINWNVKIMPVRIMNSGGGTGAAMSMGLIYAANMGARVSSNSYGGAYETPPGSIEDDSLKYEHDRGMVVVVAAGNNNIDAMGFSPARSQYAITVGGTDSNDGKASWSNWGEKLDVVAPGVGIYSTILGEPEYGYSSGTSMATPHVSGLVALLLSSNPALTNEQIRQIIRLGSDDIGMPGKDRDFGYGRINAFSTLNFAQEPVLAPVIATPRSNTVVTNQVVTVTGSANGATFQRYRLEIGAGRAPTSWQLLNESTSPVTNGVLGTVNMNTYPVGSYLVRLSAVDTSNRVFESEVFDIWVTNAPLTPTATLTPTSTPQPTATPTSMPTPTTEPTPPLGVFLNSFTAQWINIRQVRAEWMTTFEINNRGFNIWRGTTPKGPSVKLNKTIILSCSPGGTQGCSYSHTDTIPFASGSKTRPTYYYWLEDIDLNGTVTRHGPVGTDGSGGP